MAFGGISAAILGKWTMKVGTRTAMAVGGGLFGTAFAVTAAGVAMHSLPLVYAGNCKFCYTLLLINELTFYNLNNSNSWNRLWLCVYPSDSSIDRMVS